MVPDSHIEPALRSAASSVIDSLLFFNPLQWGLPPFKDAPANSAALLAPADTAITTTTATATVAAAAAASSAASTALSQVQAEPESVVALA